MMGFLFPTFANAPMDLEGKKPAPPPLYIVGRRMGASYEVLAQPSPSPKSSSSPAVLGEALPGSRYFHHHTVVLLDLHQLLLPPCWIKEETSPIPYVC